MSGSIIATIPILLLLLGKVKFIYSLSLLSFN